MRFSLFYQSLLECCSFHCRATCNGFGEEMARLPSSFEGSLDGGNRDGKGLCYLGLAEARVDARQYSLS